MDAGTWKMVAQVSIFVGAVLAALGGLGNWYFGRLEDKAKDRQASQRHDTLVGQLNTLHNDNEVLATKLSPFEELAKARFPGVSLDEALAKLRAELAQVRELATRDIPKRLRGSVRERVVAGLKSLAGKNRPGMVGLHFLNTGVRSVEQLIAALEPFLGQPRKKQQVST